jgi:hypothetical protein
LKTCNDSTQETFATRQAIVAGVKAAAPTASVRNRTFVLREQEKSKQHRNTLSPRPHRVIFSLAAEMRAATWATLLLDEKLPSS